METKELIREIQRLPIRKRILLLKSMLKSIRESEAKFKMKNAAEFLLQDYKNNKDLISFTDIDFENFYEPR